MLEFASLCTPGLVGSARDSIACETPCNCSVTCCSETTANTEPSLLALKIQDPGLLTIGLTPNCMLMSLSLHACAGLCNQVLLRSDGCIIACGSNCAPRSRIFAGSLQSPWAWALVSRPLHHTESGLYRLPPNQGRSDHAAEVEPLPAQRSPPELALSFYSSLLRLSVVGVLTGTEETAWQQIAGSSSPENLKRTLEPSSLYLKESTLNFSRHTHITRRAYSRVEGLGLGRLNDWELMTFRNGFGFVSGLTESSHHLQQTQLRNGSEVKGAAALTSHRSCQNGGRKFRDQV